MLSQYDDHLCKKCKIGLQITNTCEDVKKLDTILLLSLAVTLTFEVATQILRATRRLNMVIISVKKIEIRLQ